MTSSYWWRHHRRADTMTRALAQNLVDTNAQFQTRRWPARDAVIERLCWSIVIVLLALLLLWVGVHAPASYFTFLGLK